MKTRAPLATRRKNEPLPLCHGRLMWSGSEKALAALDSAARGNRRKLNLEFCPECRAFHISR